MDKSVGGVASLPFRMDSRFWGKESGQEPQQCSLPCHIISFLSPPFIFLIYRQTNYYFNNIY